MHTRIVGIVNITPDSFSDGGIARDAENALRAVARLIADGADVIDIGAESTRPGAQALSQAEEWERLAPVLDKTAKSCRDAEIALSVDTRHPETARRALAAGADWINDVGGFNDAAMVKAVKDSDCRLVAMHALSVPADPAIILPQGNDVIDTLLRWGKERLEKLQAQSIARSRIILDPGIGFGKTAAQSLEILRRVRELKTLEAPLLVGHSRKSFLRQFADVPAQDRDTLTAAASLYLKQQGVDWLRVHDVRQHRQTFSVWDTLCSNG